VSRILGIGVDVIDVVRIDRAANRWGDRFLKRLYTQGELAYCREQSFPAEHLAARFAAKEATMKALGTGWTSNVAFKDIEVVRQGSERPQIELHDEVRRTLPANLTLHVSLSHTHVLATAFVVAALESEPSLNSASTREKHHDQIH